MKRTPLYAVGLALLVAASVAHAQLPAAIEHYRTGYELLRARNYRNATIELQQAVAVDSTYGAAYFALGMAHRILEEYGDAIVAFERARALGTFPDRSAGELTQLYHKSGVQLFEQRKYEDAVASFRQAVQLDPTNAAALYAMGLCYKGLRDEDQAAQAFRQAAAADPTYAKPLRALGDLHRGRGEYGPAAAEYDKAIAVDSTFMEAYTGLAQVMLETGDLENVVALMRRAVTIDPQYADGFLYLGTALNRLSRHPEAVQPLTEAVRLAPTNAEAHYRLGEAQYGRGAYREAVDAGGQAVRRRRNFHAAEVLLGDAHLKLGNLEDAQSWYTRALQDSRFRDYCRHQLDEIERGGAGGQ